MCVSSPPYPPNIALHAEQARVCMRVRAHGHLQMGVAEKQSLTDSSSLMGRILSALLSPGLCVVRVVRGRTAIPLVLGARRG